MTPGNEDTGALVRHLFRQAGDALARAQAQVWQAPPHVWSRSEHRAFRTSIRALHEHYGRVDARFEAIDTRYNDDENIELILKLLEKIDDNVRRIRRFFARLPYSRVNSWAK